MRQWKMPTAYIAITFVKLRLVDEIQEAQVVALAMET